MPDNPIQLSAGDLEDDQSSAAQPIQLSAGDLEDSAPPVGPVNPYAIDMSKVAGATPGTTQPVGENPNDSQIQPTGIVDLDKSVADPSKANTYHPVKAIHDIAQGANDLAASGVLDAVGPGIGGQAPKLDQGRTVDVNKGAKAATQLMGGAMEVSKPLLPVGIAAAPFRAAVMYGAGVMAGKGAQQVAKEMGATPDEQEFWHTLGFFLPDVAIKAAALEVKPTEGQFGFKGYSARAAGGNVEATIGVRPATRVPTPEGSYGEGSTVDPGGVSGSIRVRNLQFGGKTPRETSSYLPAAPTALPQGEVLPSEPPSASAIQTAQHIDAITAAAGRAASDKLKAEQIAGAAPPPAPPPPPGAPGSKKIPLPTGMDQGELSQHTVDLAGAGIDALPLQLKAQGILSSVTNLAKWIAAKGTIVGPDNKVTTVTGQSPQSQAQSAKVIATGIINDEVDRRAEAAQAAQDAQKEAIEQRKDDITQAQEDQAAAVEPQKVTGTPSAQAEAPLSLPNSKPVLAARTALQSMPALTPADQMDKRLSGLALTTNQRKQIVTEELARRENSSNEQALHAQGIPPALGQDSKSLQTWTDKVATGEHPYVHVPTGSEFKPSGVEGLTRTPVKGAPVKEFNGTYYHAQDVSPADIRKAARDKTDPQGALDKLESDWRQDHPTELKAEDIEEGQPSNEVKKQEVAKPEGERKHKAGNTQHTLRPESDAYRAVRAAQSAIEPEDLAGNGIEGEPHVTVRYGVKDGNVEGLKKFIIQQKPFIAGLRRTDSFKPSAYSDGAATVIAPVESPELHALNAEIEKHGDFEPSSFPEYKPHVTIAYVKPEAAEKYTRDASTLYKNFLVDSIDLSDRDGNKETIRLEGPPIAPEVATGLSHIADENESTIEQVLQDPDEGKIVAQALKNDGIITDSDMNPATALLTTKTRKALTDSVLETVLGPALVKETPSFVKDKVSAALGTISIINSKDDEWNLQAAIQQAASSFNEHFKGDGGEEPGPVVTAIRTALDTFTPDDIRGAFGNYAIEAEALRRGANEDPMGIRAEPWFAFNAAFGTELTRDQFESDIRALKGGTKEEATETIPANTETNAPAEETTADVQRPIAKGDKVTFKNGKGKDLIGTVKWTDGKKVRIDYQKKEGEQFGAYSYERNVADVKPIGDVKLTDLVPAEQPEAAPSKTLAGHLYGQISSGAMPKDNNALKAIVAKFDGGIPPDGLRMKEAQEALERAIVRRARDLSYGKSGEQAFNDLVRLYSSQPLLNVRTSTSIENQAYSTPAPLAFIADRFAGIGPKTTVYEPTAGNGMLLIAANPTHVVANELNPSRMLALGEQGFITYGQDASTWTPPNVNFDAVVANPPFGPLQGPVKVDNFSIVKLDHLIAAKSLSVLKDDGKAAIIIGAMGRDEPGAVTNATRPFFNWLYSHYNVVSDFELEGDMYSRQGASWPVRVIAVEGRVRSAKVSPVAEDIKRLATWQEVYDKASEHLGPNLEGQRRADDVAGGALQQDSESGAVPKPAGSVAGAVDSGQPGEGAQDDGRGLRPSDQPRPVRHTSGVPDPGVGSPDITVRPDGDVARSNQLAEGEPAPRAVRREPAKLDGDSANALADESNQFQSTYRPFSEKKDVAVMAPKALIAPMQESMERIGKDVGDIDQWVTDELGYANPDEMHDAFMGTQVDGIAAAIHNIQQGKAVIVADQTGLGKGRQAAAVIRWAEMHGKIPVFITAGDQLFSAMHADLHDIGSGDTIAPLLFNADSTITDPVTGKKIFGNNGSMRPVFERIMQTGALPAGRNTVMLTYSQINTPNRQQLALQALAPKAVFVLDESHNAAGSDSNTGQYLQGVLSASQGVTFLSATWAKRPDNLPLYASKTDLGLAFPDKDKAVDAITAGGAPLQAIITSQLAQSAQFVRRERSFDGITFQNVVAHDMQKEHERICDEVTNVLRGIVHADSMYHNLDFDKIASDAKKNGKSAGSKGTVVNHMEFSSIVHNLVKQLLLALKADHAADMMIKAIKDGHKPIFALENTMGSFLGRYVDDVGAKDGDLLNGLTYSKILHKALERTRYYNETDVEGNKTRITVKLDDLSPKVRAAYDEAQALIDSLNVDLPVSPIDHIRNRVEQAGYKIAEITGRTQAIDYSGNVPRLTTVPEDEKKDRVATATKFNNGTIHALILNQAGSTGISLHASEKFRDQRPRLMIVGQPAGDVNIVMQMLGRTNRTGQVQLPLYAMLAVALPAEQRPAINLAKKMKSLNANLSSNTEAHTSVQAVDLMNKYGDQVIGQYLVDNPEMMKALGLDVDVSEDGKLTNTEGLSTKATGRSALLPVKAQRAFMEAISDAYIDKINFLNETGQNDLEPRTYDFDAKQTHNERIYQGPDPSSPFGADAHYGEYSIKRQGIPPTVEEVQAEIADAFGPEAMQKPAAERDTLVARAIAHHFEEMYTPYLAGLKNDNAIERAGMLRQMGRAMLNEYRVGTGLYVNINGDEFNAIVTNIEGAKRQSGNPYAPSSLKFTLAVNGPLRRLKVPGTELRRIVMHNLGRNADPRELFRVRAEGRQKAKIITGNVASAFGQLTGKSKGRIIAFTMDDGTTRQGILLPAKFDVKEDVDQAYAMRSPEGAVAYLREAGHQNTTKYLQSSDGDVGVYLDKYGEWGVKTKMSKSGGGKYFLDPALKATIVGDDFASSGGMMKGQIKEGQQVNALKIIMGKTALYPNPTDNDLARETEEEAMKTIEKTSPAAKRLNIGNTMSFMGTGAVGPLAKKTGEDIAHLASVVGKGTMEDLITASGAIARTAKGAGKEVAALFFPTSLASTEALDIMGRATGRPEMDQFRAGKLLEGVDKMFEGMPEADWVEFVDRIQNPDNEDYGRQATPELEKAQELIQGLLTHQREAEQIAANLGRPKGKQVELQDKADYFPNRWEKAPGSDPQDSELDRISRISRRPFEGGKNFKRQQKYTLAKGVEEGGKPIGNPVRMVMRRIQEGSKFVAAQYAMHEMKQAGDAGIYFLRKGKPLPPGDKKISDFDNIGKVWRPVETEEGGTLYQHSGDWVGNEDNLRLLENYLSRDLIRDNNIGRAAMAVKTASTQMKLGLSVFHYGAVSFWNLATGLNVALDKGYNQGVRGGDMSKVAAGLKELPAAVANVIGVIPKGKAMLEYAKNPDEYLATKEGQKWANDNPDWPHMEKLLFSAGLRWGLNQDFQQPDFVSTMMGDIQNGHLGKAVVKIVPWLAQGIVRPLFEHYIPRAKWVLASKLLADKMEQYSQALADGTITEDTIARQVVATIENRFGEFNYGRLYWDNTLKAALQLALTAPGWKYGTVATGVGAFTDFKHSREDRASERPGANRVLSNLPAMGLNQGAILSAAIVMAVVASVISYIATRKSAWKLAQEDHEKNGTPFPLALALELSHPRTGGQDQYGNPNRFTFPTDFRDYEHMALNPAGYVKGSLSAPLSSAIDTFTNRDYQNNYVYNAEDPIWKRIEQATGYNLKNDFTPISASNFVDKRGSQDAGSRLTRALGVGNGTPKAYDRSSALNKAIAEHQQHEGPQTPEEVEAREMAKEHPTQHSVRMAMREKNIPYLERIFMMRKEQGGLSYQEKSDIYNKLATPDERAMLAPIMRRAQSAMIAQARRTHQ